VQSADILWYFTLTNQYELSVNIADVQLPYLLIRYTTNAIAQEISQEISIEPLPLKFRLDQSQIITPGHYW
jgi:hypothetical protein